MCPIHVAKTKALLSFTATAKLIYAFGFAYVDCWFSDALAHIIIYNQIGYFFAEVCKGFEFCLFELMLNAPVNSYGHVRMRPPFYRTSQNEDVMTSNKCFKYIRLSHKRHTYGWFDLNHFSWEGSDHRS